MKKKKLLTASVLTMCAVLLVVGSVLTTMALLTSTAGVSNTFTVGNVSITMDETKVNVDGVPVDNAARVDANSYHLLPGKKYTKDPTIHIKSGEHDEMILFVKSHNDIRGIEAQNVDAESSSKSMRQQMIDNGWVEYVRSGNGIEIIWVYGTRDTQSGKITPTKVDCDDVQVRKSSGSTVNGPAGDFMLCEQFTIHDDADVSLYGAATVTFTAYAVQGDGLTGTDHTLTKVAWEAVKEAIPYSTAIESPVNPYNNATGVGAYAPVEGVDGPLPVPTTPSTPGDGEGTGT